MTPAQFDDVHVGDRVRHTSCGEGVVVAKGATIDVQFDAAGGRRGKRTGNYDRNWFVIATSKLIKLTT
jgi:hypothetical protein